MSGNESSNMDKSRYERRLEKWFKSLSSEKKIYAAILAMGAVGSVLHILLESVDHDFTSESRDSSSNRVLGDGWSWVGKRKDIADFEWTFWFLDLREYIILAILGHILISLLAAWFIPSLKDIAQSVYCIYCVRAALGLPYVFFVTAICTAFYFASFWKSNRICWIFTVGNILLLHAGASYQILTSLVENQLFIPLAYSGIAFSTLRCCSFVLEANEVNDKEDKNQEQFDLHQLIQYNFYLPYFFFGPLMTYDAYEKKQAVFPTNENLMKLLKEAGITIVGIAAVDFLLHFLHISSLAADIDFLRSSPAYVVGFLTFFNVLLDWSKAWVLYRITSSIAKTVDGCSLAPEGPPCIATIRTFAETYFDRGIQYWVCRYLYDPYGKGHKIVSNEAVAALLSFMFVSLWLGPSSQVLTWAFFNWFGLTFELFIFTTILSNVKINKRIEAFFFGINYWCILIYSAVGINGISTALESARIMFLNASLWNIAICTLLSYCYASIIAPDVKSKVQ